MELMASDIEPYLFMVCNEFKEYQIGNRQGKKTKTKTNAMDSWLNNHSEVDVNNEDEEEKWHMMPQTTTTTTTEEEEEGIFGIRDYLHFLRQLQSKVTNKQLCSYYR
ncbi:hypothetical protein RFI_03176, partial [Reticulomyxa filosa]